MAPFATDDDVSGRLGRDLTVEESAQVALLLGFATDLVLDALGKTQAWADALDPVPGVLRLVTIEAVARVLLNPSGATTSSETIGAYSHSERFDAPSAGPQGLSLTDAEERRVRRAVYGANTAGAQVGSILRSP